MPDDEPPLPPIPFFLVVIDHDQGFFSVEGPMTDDRAWQAAVRRAWSQRHRSIESGPTGPDRDALAAEFSQTHNLAGVPPGSIVRPHQ
jgi:hypothetical protein